MAREAKRFKTIITLDLFDGIVYKEMSTEMDEVDETSRIENVFLSYKSLLRCHGLSRNVKEYQNQKVGFGHILSVIRPVVLQIRFLSDLDLSHHNLIIGFNGCMRRSIELSDAVQPLDSAELATMHKNNKTISIDRVVNCSMSPIRENSNKKMFQIDMKKHFVILAHINFKS